MAHLTKVESKNLFETSKPQGSSFLHEAGAISYDAMSVAMDAERERPFAVAVDQTPEQCQQTRNANYPHYDWGSVRNLTPRKRGHHY